MRLTVRAMTDTPTEDPWMSAPVEVDVPADTPVAEAFQVAPIGRVFPEAFNGWEWWEPWLRKPSGEWFTDFGIPWALARDGQLVWEPDAKALCVGELRRSIDEGVLQADGSCIHFWAVNGLGGANGPELLAWWPAFRCWLSILADVSALGVLLAGLIAAVRATWRRLEARNADPEGFIDFILSRKNQGHDSHQLATLLSMDEEQARACLLALGFVESQGVPGHFVFDPSPQALELLRRIEGVRNYQAEGALPPAVADRLFAGESPEEILGDTAFPSV